MLELTLFTAVFAATLLVMMPYVKRAISGWYRDAGDSLGEQYEPGNSRSNSTTTEKSNVTTTSTLIKKMDIGQGLKADVIDTTTTINEDSSDKSGEETVGPLDKKSFWK